MNKKQILDGYIAKATQAETNAASAVDQVTKEIWQKIAETFRQLAGRLK